MGFVVFHSCMSATHEKGWAAHCVCILAFIYPFTHQDQYSCGQHKPVKNVSYQLIGTDCIHPEKVYLFSRLCHSRQVFCPASIAYLYHKWAKTAWLVVSENVYIGLYIDVRLFRCLISVLFWQSPLIYLHTDISAVCICWHLVLKPPGLQLKCQQTVISVTRGNKHTS